MAPLHAEHDADERDRLPQRTAGRPPAPVAACRGSRRRRPRARTGAGRRRPRPHHQQADTTVAVKAPANTHQSARRQSSPAMITLLPPEITRGDGVAVGARAPVLDLVHRVGQQALDQHAQRHRAQVVATRRIPAVRGQRRAERDSREAPQQHRDHPHLQPHPAKASRHTRLTLPARSPDPSERVPTIVRWHDPGESSRGGHGAAPQVEAWRLHVLLQAGYPLRRRRAAGRSDADLHQGRGDAEPRLLRPRGRPDPHLSQLEAWAANRHQARAGSRRRRPTATGPSTPWPGSTRAWPTGSARLPQRLGRGRAVGARAHRPLGARLLPA